MKATGEGLLINEIHWWMTGDNRNVHGKQTRKIMCYSAATPSFASTAMRLPQTAISKWALT